jgi:ATP-binding cassette, subfamily B, bacterial PglK
LISQLFGVWELLSTSERRQSVLLLGNLLLGGFLEALAIGAVLPLIAMLSEEDPTTHHPLIARIHQAVGEPEQNEFLLMGIGFIVGVFFLKSLVLGAMYWFQNSFSASVRERLARDMFQHYLEQEYTFHLQKNSVSLVTKLTVESGQVAALVTHNLVLATEGVVIFGIIVVLLIADPAAVLLASVSAGVMGYVFLKFLSSRLHRWGTERRDNEDGRRLEAQHAFGAFKELEVLGRKNYFAGRFSTRSRATMRASRNLGFTANLPRLWLEPMAMLGLFILSFWFLNNGAQVETLIPILGVFVAAGVRLLPSFARIVTAVQRIKFTQPALLGIRDELLQIRQNSYESSDDALAGKQGFGPLKSIEFNDVAYRYPDSRDSGFKGINFQVEAGTSVGIIGRTGAGKTTIVDLLLGLLEPHDGVIQVNGVDIRTDMRSWTSTIGYVPQNIFLIDDSIIKNVALGVADGDVDEAQVMSALESAQLVDFVDSLPEGLATIIGEGGVRLSGGERQRIGIARALYHGPSVLVFDEATSALDLETERRFTETIKDIYGLQTIFIVAHRKSALEGVSQLFEISDGRLTKLDQ